MGNHGGTRRGALARRPPRAAAMSRLAHPPAGAEGDPTAVARAQAALDAARVAVERATEAWRAAPMGSQAKADAALARWEAQRNVLEAEGKLDAVRGGTGYAIGYDNDATHAALSGMLGPDAETLIGRMTGAGYADRVTVALNDDGSLTLERTGRAIQAGTGRADMTLTRAADGSLVAEVGVVRSDAKTAGSGLDLIASMQALREAGVARVTAEAAGSAANPHMNGYWTWARAGAEGPIPGDVLPAARAAFGPGVARVEQVMDRPGGPAWWRAHGTAFEATLDLSPGGRTARYLDRLARRGSGRTGGV